MHHPNKDIMNKAIELAIEKHKEGGHAVAAIIVKDDEIISEAFTTVRRDIDPTAHAEINTIRAAAKSLGINCSTAICILLMNHVQCVPRPLYGQR